MADISYPQIQPAKEPQKGLAWAQQGKCNTRLQYVLQKVIYKIATV